MLTWLILTMALAGPGDITSFAYKECPVFQTIRRCPYCGEERVTAEGEACDEGCVPRIHFATLQSYYSTHQTWLAGASGRRFVMCPKRMGDALAALGFEELPAPKGAKP